MKNNQKVKIYEKLSEKDVNRILIFIAFMIIFTISLGSIVGCIWFGFSGFLEVLFLISCFITYKIFKMYIKYMKVHERYYKDKYDIVKDLFLLDNIEDFSDGFHTFRELYAQKLFMFSVIVNTYKDKAWKSKKHNDGKECFGGEWFIAGVDTPKGQYTCHFKMKEWKKFDCEELKVAKKWDKHTIKDAYRLLSLVSRKGR